MKKNIYLLFLPLALVCGLLFTYCESKNEGKKAQKAFPITDTKTNLDKRKKWEASPDGIQFNEWKNSPEGKKIQGSYDKIKKSIKGFSNMKAVVTSVTFQRTNGKSPGPNWLIVKIKDDEYMMQFTPKDFKLFNNLKVNDKIIVKSRSAGFSPNHPYLILSSDYISHNNKILFKRDFTKNKGC